MGPDSDSSGGHLQPAGQLSRTAPRADIHSVSSQVSLMNPNQRHELLQNYSPQPVDTSNLSLSRELQNLTEKSAENAHDPWARKTMEDWTLKMSQTSSDSFRPPIMSHLLC